MYCGTIMSQPLRDFSALQVRHRIGLKKAFVKELGWEVGDQLLIEVYKGRLLVENLSKGLLPAKERLK
ncbi:unnamed protein product [marine sediment metagenome]|uniref:SpoVT-AbrB domain-containing protein n=1 Tax=marine sediment metagenome TaxID=412755 RepID=X0TKQ5_9ZZZZ